MTGPVNLVLIGPMGSGKSSVAREIARATGRRWVDTDKLVVNQVGLSITEIFALEGEERFRDRETVALRSLAPDRRLVIATGGGIVTRPENIGLLQALGIVVWLTAREDVLFERVSRNHRRPLLHTADPRATLHDLLARRQGRYEACASFCIDTSDDPHARLAETILARTGALSSAPVPP